MIEQWEWTDYARIHSQWCEMRHKELKRARRDIVRALQRRAAG